MTHTIHSMSGIWQSGAVLIPCLLAFCLCNLYAALKGEDMFPTQETNQSAATSPTCSSSSSPQPSSS